MISKEMKELHSLWNKVYDLEKQLDDLKMLKTMYESKIVQLDAMILRVEALEPKKEGISIYKSIQKSTKDDIVSVSYQ